MSTSLKSVALKIEYKYGKLGEAQNRALEEFFMEDSDFAKRQIEDIWIIINKELADKKYVPLSERAGSMDNLFPSGDEYPDIYRESLTQVDMNDFL
ncbi:MAG: hypothetical protein NE328_11945 [Lentisphaeraceae bacterium]|nr:hypothetical protein [Lentisphaeraceae bacterium]